LPETVVNTFFPVGEQKKFSVEEFFTLTASRPEEERWQLIDGVLMRSPRPTLVHQRIASNLTHALNEHFRSHRRDVFAYYSVGLIVPDAELFRPEADVAVLDALADYESYAKKFYLVAEILSDSNTDKDIAVKRQRYLQHPDNLYFALIEQKRMRLELLARTTGWQPMVLETPDAILELPEFGFRKPLGDLYRGTPLAPSAQA